MKKIIRKGYHHGDLFRALVNAGTDIVEKLGIESISLRSVARKAMVSHAAPYHYFPSKSALLAAIAAGGFGDLVCEIKRTTETLQPADARNALKCVGLGYLRFAVRRPSLFRLMFRPELTEPAKHAQLKQAESLAFGVLFGSMQAFLKEAGASHADARVASAYCWSTVHGLAMLHIDAVLAETPVGELPVEQLAETLVNFTVTGIQNSLIVNSERVG